MLWLTDRPKPPAGWGESANGVLSYSSMLNCVGSAPVAASGNSKRKVITSDAAKFGRDLLLSISMVGFATVTV